MNLFAQAFEALASSLGALSPGHIPTPPPVYTFLILIDFRLNFIARNMNNISKFPFQLKSVEICADLVAPALIPPKRHQFT